MTQQMGIKAILEGEHRWIDGRSDRFAQSLAKAKITPDSFQEAAKVLH